MLVSLGVVSSLTGFHTQQSALDLCRSSSASVAFSLSHLSLKTLCCFVVLGLDSLNHELVSFSWLHMSAFFAIIVANMVPYFRLDLFCISLLMFITFMCAHENLCIYDDNLCFLLRVDVRLSTTLFFGYEFQFCGCMLRCLILFLGVCRN